MRRTRSHVVVCLVVAGACASAGPSAASADDPPVRTPRLVGKPIVAFEPADRAFPESVPVFYVYFRLERPIPVTKRGRSQGLAVVDGAGGYRGVAPLRGASRRWRGYCYIQTVENNDHYSRTMLSPRVGALVTVEVGQGNGEAGATYKYTKRGARLERSPGDDRVLPYAKRLGCWR